MPVLARLLEVVKAQVVQIGWLFLVGLMLGHLLVSWLLLALAGESELTAPEVWLYFYITTSTTIGYGDYSPVTTLGRLITAFWVMPGGVALFAALIGKSTSVLVEFWRTGMKGKQDYSHLESHTVLIGWHGDATERMIDLLLADSTSREDRIVLCATEDMENPLPGKVAFVRGESFAQPGMLQRAGVRTAERILVYGNSDDQTFATAMAVLSLRPIGHVVVHFETQASADLLRTHYPQVECTQGLAVEMLVRAAQDPGVSRVTTELLSVLTGPTSFSVPVPAAVSSAQFGRLLVHFKQRYNATLLGFAKSADGEGFRLNPGFDEALRGGDILYYIADARIDVQTLDWGSLTEGAA